VITSGTRSQNGLRVPLLSLGGRAGQMPSCTAFNVQSTPALNYCGPRQTASLCLTIFPTAERESRGTMGEMDAPSISVDHAMRC
jgi:hypothetical protein